MFASELMLCLSSVFVPQAPPNAPAVVLQEIPLRGIIGPARGVPLPSPFIVGSEGSESGWGGLQPATSNDIAAALHTQFQAATDANELYIDVNDSRATLALRGSKELTQAAAAYAAWLERTLSRGVQIDMRIYAVDAIPSDARGTYAPGALANVNGLRPLWSGSTTGTVHRASTFEAITRQPVMIDFDVEVAQKADIADPKVSAILIGVQATVLPFALAGSDDIGVLADVGFGVRRDSGDQWSSGVLKQPLLDSPKLDRVATGMAGRVQSGGSLVVWAGGDAAFGPQIAIEFAVRWRGPAPQAPRDAAAMPLAFALPGLELRSAEGNGELVYTPGDDDLLASPAGRSSARSVFQFDELISMVRESLGDPDGGAADRAGCVAIVHGTSEQIARARQLVVDLIDSSVVGADVIAETRSDDGKLVVHRAIVPTLLGVPSYLDRGLEGVYVRDLDVEIAQSATAMNPVIERWFSGLRCQAVIARSIGGLSADVGVDLSLRAPTQRRAIEGDRGGAIDVSATDGRRMITRGAIERGETISLGQGPAISREGTTLRVQQSITVR